MKKTMTQEEMMNFIYHIGRCELWDEFKEIRKSGAREFGSTYPRYLKAIRVTLVTLGYDEKWVEGEFRRALEGYWFEREKEIVPSYGYRTEYEIETYKKMKDMLDDITKDL